MKGQEGRNQQCLSVPVAVDEQRKALAEDTSGPGCRSRSFLVIVSSAADRPLQAYMFG